MATPRARAKSARGASTERKGARDADAALFVDLVGSEISAIWRNVTRLGGQCVAALYLEAGPLSMDELATRLGRSKSNVFSNLRALESLGIVRRVRVEASARDHYALAGAYPDVIMLAFVRKLSDSLADKSRDLRAIAERMAARGADETEKVARVRHLGDTYAQAGAVLEAVLPPPGQSLDLGALLGRVPPDLVRQVARMLRGDS